MNMTCAAQETQRRTARGSRYTHIFAELGKGVLVCESARSGNLKGTEVYIGRGNAGRNESLRAGLRDEREGERENSYIESVVELALADHNAALYVSPIKRPSQFIHTVCCKYTGNYHIKGSTPTTGGGGESGARPRAYTASPHLYGGVARRKGIAWRISRAGSDPAGRGGGGEGGGKEERRTPSKKEPRRIDLSSSARRPFSNFRSAGESYANPSLYPPARILEERGGTPAGEAGGEGERLRDFERPDELDIDSIGDRFVFNGCFRMEAREYPDWKSRGNRTPLSLSLSLLPPGLSTPI